MTSTAPPSAADYLATLPPPIQAELAEIVRAAIGMTAEEKGFATGAFALTAFELARSGPDESLPVGRMLAALGMTARLAHDYATEGGN